VEVWRAERIDPYGLHELRGRHQLDASERGTSLEYNLRWPGHYLDPETGLHYNRYRYYDPRLGRYLQSDLSKPVYVQNNPPPGRMTQFVKSHGYAGNFFDPIGGQTPLNRDPAVRQPKVFDVPATNPPIRHSKASSAVMGQSLMIGLTQPTRFVRRARGRR
jgi:RHS repeat-associated protein